MNWNEYLLKNTHQSIDIRESSVYRRGYNEGYFEGFNNAIKIFQKDLELARLSRPVVIKINNHKINSD
ncbi:MAG TPA: hypothetical protein GXZ35_04395 [Acholeplasmataceae bacterium]|nr:hypothetical protein [Acholeplasmataceae bacterium]